MIYTSERGMSDLASGLIEGSIKYYNENITYEKELMTEDGKQVKFELIHHA